MQVTALTLVVADGCGKFCCVLAAHWTAKCPILVVFHRKGTQHENESIDGHGRRCCGGLGSRCYVDRTIGLG
jgi:hypothetical protein